jgi:predicted phage-related endonuclease
MKRTVLNVKQGTPEWLAARASSDGTASEAPAMKGKSKYQSRQELLTQRKTGITKDVDSFTQAIFNKGHDTEAKARPLAEEIIGDELSATTIMVEIDGLKLLASLDGITFDDSVIFEHKLWNEPLAEQVRSGQLEEHYTIQMDQELLVSGASKCLFMVSDGTRDKNVSMWYESSQEKFDTLIAGWKQFHKDLADHVPTIEAVKPKAQAILALPSLAIQIKGEVTLSNLPEFKEAATAFIANINTDLVTDEDFANAEANVTFCKEAEENIEATKKSAIAQTASIDELMRTLDFISAQLRDKRLDLSSKVKTEKENRKLQIIKAAQDDLAKHFTALSAEIKPIALNTTPADFAGAIKGKKTITGMQGAVNQVLADSKITLDATARDIRTKQAWLKENADGYQFLFADIQTVIYKPMDDMQVLVKSRIAEHKQVEAANAEAARVQAEVDRIAAQVKSEITAPANNVINETDFIREIANTGLGVSVITLDSDTGITKANIPTSYFYGVEPTANEIVSALANAFKVDELQAHAWLIKADFTQYNPAKKAA